MAISPRSMSEFSSHSTLQIVGFFKTNLLKLNLNFLSV